MAVFTAHGHVCVNYQGYKQEKCFPLRKVIYDFAFLCATSVESKNKKKTLPRNFAR